MKSLEEILNTPVEEMGYLNDEELDLFIKKLEEDFEPDFNFEKINQHVYRFRIGQLLYQVDITESILSNKKKMIEIKFKLLNNPDAPKRINFQTYQQYQIALQKSQVGVTGTGNPIKVFKKVFGSIVISIKDIKPDYISFVADESRQGLYSKFIKILKPYIPIEYKRLTINPLTGDEIGNEEFWLEKQENNILPVVNVDT
jgi:hypothetical protein